MENSSRLDHLSTTQNSSDMVESEIMEWNSVVETRHYEIYMPVFSYLLGMYLITVGKEFIYKFIG